MAGSWSRTQSILGATCEESRFAAVRPDDGWPQHLVLLANADQAINLAAQGERNDLSRLRSRFSHYLSHSCCECDFPVCGVLFGPVGRGIAWIICSIGTGNDGTGDIQQHGLHALRTDVRANDVAIGCRFHACSASSASASRALHFSRMTRHSARVMAVGCLC